VDLGHPADWSEIESRYDRGAGTKRSAWTLLLPLVSVLLIACGSGDDPGSGSNTGGTGGSAGEAGLDASAGAAGNAGSAGAAGNAGSAGEGGFGGNPKDGGLEDASSGDVLDGSGDGSTSPGDWQIPAEQRVGQKLPMHVVFPRPDAETPAQAFHRNAHTQIPYRIPIGIQAGEWPFRFEMLEGPAGAEFVAGELQRTTSPEGWTVHRRTPGYGVLEWPSPEPGTHPFRVRVADQAGDTVDPEWNVETHDDAFVFVDSVAGDDGAPGTFSDPLKTFALGLWRNDDADDTFAGRVAVFRPGDYQIYASAPNTSPILSSSNKPIAIVAHPGEHVTFDLSSGHFRTSGNGGFNDYVIAGIDFDGSRSDLANNRLFNITNRTERPTFWGCSFDHTTVGTVGTDNPGCIAFMSDGAYHENVAILDCELRANAATQLIVSFDSNYALIENNRAIDVSIPVSNGDMFIHPKDDTNNLTVRDNQLRGRVAANGIDLSNQVTLGATSSQEVCWNTLIYDGDQNVDAAIGMNSQSNTPDATNTYVYRNTVVSERRTIRFAGNQSSPVPPLVEGNACFGALGGLMGSNYVEGPVENVELLSTDFGADGDLVGSARNTYAGYAGAELVSR